MFCVQVFTFRVEILRMCKIYVLLAIKIRALYLLSVCKIYYLLLNTYFLVYTLYIYKENLYFIPVGICCRIYSSSIWKVSTTISPRIDFSFLYWTKWNMWIVWKVSSISNALRRHSVDSNCEWLPERKFLMAIITKEHRSNTIIIIIYINT